MHGELLEERMIVDRDSGERCSLEEGRDGWVGRW
jgi:hypothetical protein